MYVYEVKVVITAQLTKPFSRWLRPHAQQVVATGCFTNFTISQESAGSRSIFRCHYFYQQPADFERYCNDFAKELRADMPAEFHGHLEFMRSQFVVADDHRVLSDQPHPSLEPAG